MFPYPDQYRVAMPPMTTALMVVWALMTHAIFTDASPFLNDEKAALEQGVD